MKFTTCAGIFALVGMASAHTLITNIIADGTTYDYKECIRPYYKKQNFPVTDATDPDITCRTTSMDSSKTKTCPIKAGSTLTLEYHRNKKKGDVISASHRGACTAYISPLDQNGEGKVWVKLYQFGYDEGSGWCTDMLIDNDGKLEVPIPANLENGDYLVRGEIIALHNAKRGEPQIFSNCAQITVTGGGSTPLPEGVALPGAYKQSDPGLTFNIHDKKADMADYVVPGPDVWKP
ncbi:hypothetical protein GGF46_003407 [Coemansia sp. RSA 552]|nr:hypothetical protein GGF46_003407 [Coemansia sp. RSA 552]